MQHNKVTLVNSTTQNTQKAQDKTEERAQFSRLLRHPAKKRTESHLPTPQPACGLDPKPVGSCNRGKRVTNYLPFNSHFLGGPGLAGTRMSPLWILLEPRSMEVVSGDNWSYKTCKAPVKSSPSTNQHPTFYRPDALPVAQPTASRH